MPFKSETQRRFMHARHPKIAKRWEKHTPKGKKLPEKVQNDGADEDIEESFERKLNEVLGLEEAAATDPQTTTRPRLGATRGASKGARRRQLGRKEKEKDVESVGEG